MDNKGQAGVQGFRMTMRRALAQALCALALLLAGSAGAYAQDGHNHGAEPRAISVAPRAETRIGNQEAVIAYDRNRLVLFLQRYSDGEPTNGAQLEMTVDFVPVSFEEVAPGTYVATDVMLAAGLEPMRRSRDAKRWCAARLALIRRPTGSNTSTGFGMWVKSVLAATGTISRKRSRNIAQVTPTPAIAKPTGVWSISGYGPRRRM